MAKGKRPAYLYYPDDFDRDLKPFGPTIAGAWQFTLNHLFWTGGEDTLSVEEWARVFGVASVEEANTILKGFERLHSCDISVTRNGSVTLRSRRMYRENKAREDNRLRQKNHRDKQK